MTRSLCLMGFVLLSFGAGAQAQTASEHEACARDAARFCRPVMGEGDGAVLSCLQHHRARISHTCERVMATHGQ